MEGRCLSVGNGCPPNVIIGTDGSAVSVNGAGTTGVTGASTGFALAIAVRDTGRGRSRTFHGRISSESVPSSAGALLGRFGLRGSCGKTQDSNCMNGDLAAARETVRELPISW